MAAIDPARLEREVRELEQHFSEPAALRREVLALLDFYANRARRPGASSAASDVPCSFGVPRPVLHSMRKVLRQRAADDPGGAMAAADALWETGYREARLLAAGIVGSQRGGTVADWVEAHAPHCDDSVALAELAGAGLSGWRKSDVSAFLERVATWMEGQGPRLQSLAMSALTAAVEDTSFEHLPALLTRLEGKAGKARGEAKRAMVSLVRSMARRSPPEAARFLLDEMERGTPGASRLAASVLEAFPEAQRRRLASALRAH